MRQIRDRQCLFIALTASAIDTEKAHILKAGFDGCICKPISLDELKQCLIEACSTLNIPPGNSGLDWQHSLSICSGDSTLAQQMLSNLLTEIPAMLNSLKVNDSRLLDTEDVHQWAGITSYTGAIHLKELMLELEQLLCRGNYSEANHQLSLLQQELSIVMAQGLQLVRHDNKSNALKWSG
jgi:two-component system sensor histidine kinase BarA